MPGDEERSQKAREEQMPGDEERSEEARGAMTRKKPATPSRREREEHELTHVPFRTWCKACMEGGGKNVPHRKREPRELTHPHVHIDYAFLRDERKGDMIPIAVMREEESKALAGHAVPGKGDVEWVATQLVRDLRKWGVRGNVTVKSDQEPAIISLVEGLARERARLHPEARTIIEHSPVAESASNGIAERAVQALENQIRVLKLGLEEKLKASVPVSHPVVPWIIEHAADILTKYPVSKDGKTPYERLKGKRYRGEIFEIGQVVTYRIPGKVEGGLLRARWRRAIWLGKRFASDEHVLAQEGGDVVRARGVRPVSEEESWNKELVDKIRGRPWDPSGTGSEVGEAESGGLLIPRAVEHPAEQVNPREAPRGVRITRELVQRFGTSLGCSKCRALLEGNKAHTLNHSTECRERIVKRMREDPVLKETVEASDYRKTEWLAKQLEAGVKRSRAEETQERPQPDVKTARVEPAEETAVEPGDAQEEIPMAPIDPSEEARVEPVAEETARGQKRDRGERGLDEDAIEEPATHYRQVEEDRKRERAASSWENPEDEEPQGQRARLDPQQEINSVSKQRGTFDVCEAFSPPRVCARAHLHGLRGGWSLDREHVDPQSGRLWDLLEKKEQLRALGRLKKDMPRVLITCPPCTQFSVLQNLNPHARCSEDWKRAVEMVNFAVSLCEEQDRAARSFVFEHPQSASSWGLESLRRLKARSGVMQVDLHMCAFGMTAEDQLGCAPVYKPTRLLTNSEAIAGYMRRRCGGGHRHVHLVGGRAATAAKYPDEFCDALLRGVQVEVRGAEERLQDLSCLALEAEELHEQGGEFDTVEADGLTLPAKLVAAGRAEEIRIFREMDVYTPIEKGALPPGAVVIGTRWVDVNKGSKEAPEVRCRLVAKEYASERREDLFAGTPSMASVKFMLSLLASSEGGMAPTSTRMLILDIKRAFLHGRAKRELYVELPREDPRWRPNLCARLNRSMYGTRDAPQIWQEEVRNKMQSIGFVSSKVSPCVYFHKQKGIWSLAHVDDFIAVGAKSQLNWLREELGRTYPLKGKMLGPGSDESSEVEFLGRRIAWESEGLKYYSDPKHIDVMLSEWGMSECRTVVSPGVKSEKSESEERELSGSQLRRYRASAARLNYISMDRADVAFASKEIARRMSQPRESDEIPVKRVLRYLAGRRELGQVFAWQSMPSAPEVYTDSDWAGCVETRRSTSGGVLAWGSHLLSHWSRTQANVALSSGEAELNAMVMGASELMGFINLLKEAAVLSAETQGTLRTDSSAARGTSLRQGTGKIKHLGVKQLWIQELTARDAISIKGVPREYNPSDVLTHHWEPAAALKHFRAMGYDLR